MRKRQQVLSIFALILWMFQGCASYHPMQLDAAKVASGLAPPDMTTLRIQAQQIKHPILKPISIDGQRGLGPDQVAILAVLVNPTLRAERDKRGISAAQLLQAGILPNPIFTGSMDFPIGGATAGTVNAYGLSLDYGIYSLIIRGAKVDAATANDTSVALDVAWQEWQVAEAAKHHAYRVLLLERQLAVAEQEEQGLRQNLEAVKRAVQLGEMTIIDLSAVRASVERVHLSVLGIEQDLAQERLALSQSMGFPPDYAVPLRKEIEIPQAEPLLADHILSSKDAEQKEGGVIIDLFHRGYEALLRRLLAHPWLLLVILVPLVLTGWLRYKHVGSGFMPTMDEGGFILDYKAPPGTSVTETDRLLRQVGSILRSNPAVQTYSRRTGLALGGTLSEPNEGDFFVRLKPLPRPRIWRVMEQVRLQIEHTVPGLEIEMAQLMEDLIGDLTAVPQPMEIKLFSDNGGLLRQSAPKVADAIGKIPGVVEVKDGVVLSGDALRIKIDRVRAALEGVDPESVTKILEGVMTGMVTTQIQRGPKMMGLRVWVPETMRATEWNLVHWEYIGKEPVFFERALSLHGPLVHIANLSGTGWRHALVLTGIYTHPVDVYRIMFNDPDGGRRREMSFHDFSQNYPPLFNRAASQCVIHALPLYRRAGR